MASKTFKTEAIVLRSIRYSEADRILHLYSPDYGRLGAIAKGVRKPRSRFGGRLEPFFRLDLVLYRGRGDLATVSAAETLHGYGALRMSAAGLNAAARACDAVLRLLDSTEANRHAYNLLCRYLGQVDAACEAGLSPDPGRLMAHALAFRLKLLVAAGFAPELASCATCGSREHLEGFSGAAGGVVCTTCFGGAFPLAAESHQFMATALAQPLNRAPEATERTARQVERAISDLVEHHAHVQLRAA